jgi:hypothetical protein
MVGRYELSDAQWQRIAHLLSGKAGDRGRTGADNRNGAPRAIAAPRAVIFKVSHSPRDNLLDTHRAILYA